MSYQSIEDVLKQIRDVKTWDTSQEKSMAMKALGSLLLTFTYGKQFRPGVFFDISTYSPVMLHNRLIHWLSCHWVEYDDHNAFDATKQACLICGRTQSCIMARSYAFMEDTKPDFNKTELAELREYLKKCMGDRHV